MSSWDYVIVGAGSAGCAAAYELARSGRDKVLLLEAGGGNRSLYIRIPALVVHAGKKFDWHYLSQPDPSRGGKIDKWTRGRVLGGTSSVNGMMFVRGAPEDFERWSAAGNWTWSYGEVIPLYRDMETSDQAGHTRGDRGPMHVRTVRGAHSLSDAFVKSAVEAGFPFNVDYNGERQEGVSYAQLSQRNGLRCSSADAFVRRLSGCDNFKLQLSTEVTRVHVKSGTATGVTCVRGGAREFIAAARVIICAGAINSPKLLMLSGIGNVSELQHLGIEAVVNLPEVGKNLRDHPLLRMVYKTRMQSNNLTGGILQRMNIAWQFLRRRQGPISTPFEAVAFLRTLRTLGHADIQLHFVPFGFLGPDNPSPFLDFPAVSVYLNANYPKSRGRIRLASADPAQPPLIECNLLADPEDLETLARGIRVARDIARTRPLGDLIEEEIIPGSAYGSNEDLRRYVRAHTEIAYHPIGTCRMGSDPAAVVTPDLRVNGIESLWVADASVLPDHISGNPNAVCILAGMKLGRYLNAN